MATYKLNIERDGLGLILSVKAESRDEALRKFNTLWRHEVEFELDGGFSGSFYIYPRELLLRKDDIYWDGDDDDDDDDDDYNGDDDNHDGNDDDDDYDGDDDDDDEELEDEELEDELHIL